MNGHWRRIQILLTVSLVTTTLFSSMHSAMAQENQTKRPIDIIAVFDPPTTLLGQHTWLKISVQHGNDLLISVSNPRQTNNLKVLNTFPPTMEAVDEDIITTFVYEIAGFSLGQIQPREFHVSWLSSDGTTGTVGLLPPPLIVQSTLTGNDAELRTLKPQVEIHGAPAQWRQPLTIAAVLGSLALMSTTTLIVLTRRHGKLEHRPTETAEESARHSLNRLSSESLVVDRDFDDYYGTISVVIRDHLQHHFGFGATAMTTDELKSLMISSGIGRWQARLVSGLLDRCDAAVYAQDYPDPASADHDLTVAYEIINLSGSNQDDGRV